MTPFNPFPVPALGFPMLLISLSFLCSCNMWCVHVSVWFQNDIQNLDYWLNVVLPWTNSAFPYLRPHLLDRWGGGRGASTPADVLFLIILLWHSFGSREGDNKSIFFVVRHIIFPVWQCFSSCANYSCWITICSCWIYIKFETSLILFVSNIAECEGSLGNQYALQSPLNSFNTSMLTCLDFLFLYTSITSARAGEIFLKILCGPAQYVLDFSQLPWIIFRSKTQIHSPISNFDKIGL